MRKLWLVARHEYLKIIRKRSFLLSTAGMPIFLVAIMAFSILTAIGGSDRAPLGYVDHSGLLAAPVMPTSDRLGEEIIEIRAFADEAAARAALEAGQIQGYYVLPADYLDSLSVRLVYWDQAPAARIQNDFDQFLRANLVSGLPAQAQERALKGVELTVRSADGKQELSSAGLANVILPFGFGFFFIFAVMNSAGYLLQAVADEKENRTVEVMATSLTPEQLIGGKAVGLIAVAMTQIVILAAVIGLGLAVGSRYLDALRELRVPWSFLMVSVLYFVPSYTLIAGLMIAIGSAVTEVRQGQQIAGVFNMLFSIPYFFLLMFITNPNSPLAVILTLFPTTAFTTITLRWGLTTIPPAELIAGWIILMASALLSVWAAARIFRAGMLRYGQRLDLRRMIAAVRMKAG